MKKNREGRYLKIEKVNNVNSKKIILTILILLVFGILSFFLYKDYVVPASNLDYRTIGNFNNDMILPPLIDGDVIEQSFLNTGDRIESIEIAVGTNGRANKSKLLIELRDVQANKSIQDWIIDCEKLIGDQKIKIGLAEPLINTKFTKYEIRITSKDADKNNAISLFSSEENISGPGELRINGETQKGDLGFGIYAGKAFVLQKIFKIIFVVIFMVIIILIYFTLFRNIKIEKLFLLYAILIGGIYIALIPAYSPPDEIVHVMTAYAQSNSIMGLENVDDDGKVIIRKEDSWLFYEGMSITANTYINIYNNLLKPKQLDGKTTGMREPLSTVAFYCYSPQAIGITIARVLSLNGILLLLLGRFMNLIFYSILIYYAIKIMPFAKSLLFVLALLPMSISLAASYSYDAMTIGLSFLLIAYILQLIFVKDMIKKKDWFYLVLLSLFLAPIKVIYVLIGLITLLIPKEKFGKKLHYYILSIMVFAAGMVSIIVFRLTQITAGLEDNQVVEQVTGSLYSLSDFLNSPIRIIEMGVRTIIVYIDNYFFTMLGSYLGRLNIVIPQIIMVGFFVLLLLSIIKVSEEKMVLKTSAKVTFVLISLGVSVAVAASLLFGWTASNSTIIQGIQGRYFLPVLPLVLLALRTESLQLKKNIDQGIILGVLFLQIATTNSIMQELLKKMISST